jgi:hypothetical protein
VRMKDDFAPDHPLPVFLSRGTEAYEEPRGSSWPLKAGLFVVAAIVVGAAMTLSFGYPKNIFADTSQADSPAAQVAPDQSAAPTTPADQSTDDAAQAAASAPGSATGSVPNRDEVADTSSPAPAIESPAETQEPPSGALLKQFQSWAATQDAQRQAGLPQNSPTQAEPIRPIQDAPAQVEPVRPIVQDAATQADPAQGAQDAATEPQDNPAPTRAARKHRKPAAVQNARAEIKPAKRARAGIRQDADARPPQDPRAAEQQQPAQNAQSPSLLQSLGLSR